MFRNMVTRFRIAPKKEVRELSREMQMRLMLACALSHNAKLLILDEPTSGLDPIIRDELLSILAEYTMSTEKSILFSTHITSDLEKIADYITFIDNGKMIYSGKKDQLISSFQKIEGKSINVTKQQTDKILGYRENNALFEGIINTDNLHDFSNVVIKPATMDEIMVFIHKGDTDDE
jgi:ABC-2 type transport system ATP-binding protein